MHRVRRSKCCTGTNAAINTTTFACAWRSDQTAGSGADSRHDYADAKSNRAAGNTANKSNRTAGKYSRTTGNTITNTAGRYRP